MLVAFLLMIAAYPLFGVFVVAVIVAVVAGHYSNNLPS
jgi:hypothetical protein